MRCVCVYVCVPGVGWSASTGCSEVWRHFDDSVTGTGRGDMIGTYPLVRRVFLVGSLQGVFRRRELDLGRGKRVAGGSIY